MYQQFKNNAFSALAGSLTNVATTMTVQTGHGDRFPQITAPNYAYVTLQDSSNNIEIVKVTARAAASDSMTITRAQEGTAARAWNIGDIVELRVTAAGLSQMATLDDPETLNNKTLASPTINTPTINTPTITVNDTGLTIQDSTDNTKKAVFECSGITTATTRTYTLPNISGTLAATANTAQTFSGITTFSNATVTVGSSTAASTYGLGTGATLTATTKTVNIGTAGVSGSTTNINVGSAVSGATSNLAVDAIGTYNKAQRGTISTLTDGVTITPDFAVANNFTVTLGGNRTLANPTNLVAGQSGYIVVRQDATGSRTLAFDTYWKTPSGVDPVLTTTASAIDVLGYLVISATEILINAALDMK
jgi:hypothetical protein